MRNNLETGNKEFSLPLTSVADLMGKQSVRATFKLSAECINAISILSAQLGIKQKSLFDHLMEDSDLLASIARQADPDKLQRESRIQKTFVISRKSLSILRTHPQTEGRIRRLLSLSGQKQQISPDPHILKENEFNISGHLIQIRNKPRWRIGGIWY